MALQRSRVGAPLAVSDDALRPTESTHDDDARVRRWLVKNARVPARQDDVPADDPKVAEPTLQQELGAAAVQGRTAYGPWAGAHDERPGRGSMQERWAPCDPLAAIAGDQDDRRFLSGSFAVCGRAGSRARA